MVKDNFTFNELYQNHVDMVYNLSLNYLQNTQDAEEVTQDVFIKVHEKLGAFNKKSSLKTWIYRITINQCLDFIKAKKRKKRFGNLIYLFSDNESISESIYSTTNHPGIELENKEATEKIFHEINLLPETQKTAIILKAIEGLPQKEIAEIMKLSVKAVESLLSRARKNLDRKL